MLQVFFFSLATAGISFTITETQLFKSWREWLKSKNEFIGKLFSCGYCLGHWVAFFLVCVYQPRLFFSRFFIFDYFLTAIVIAWLSGFQWSFMCWLMIVCKK